MSHDTLRESLQLFLRQKVEYRLLSPLRVLDQLNATGHPVDGLVRNVHEAVRRLLFSGSNPVRISVEDSEGRLINGHLVDATPDFVLVKVDEQGWGWDGSNEKAGEIVTLKVSDIRLVDVVGACCWSQHELACMELVTKVALVGRGDLLVTLNRQHGVIVPRVKLPEIRQLGSEFARLIDQLTKKIEPKNNTRKI